MSVAIGFSNDEVKYCIGIGRCIAACSRCVGARA